MNRAEVNQYFFIFGAIVVALFLFASYVSLERLFDFTEPKQIVTLDSIEILLESIDAQQGTYLSGYVTPEAPVVFKENTSGRTISIESGPERQLVLRNQVGPDEFVIEGTVRIGAVVDDEAINFSTVQEPDCDPEPVTLEELLDRDGVEVDARRPGSLENPRSIVVLAATADAYCSVIGLEGEVQAFVTEHVDWFSEKEVFVVVA